MRKKERKENRATKIPIKKHMKKMMRKKERKEKRQTKIPKNEEK